jgi:hypothetical protein
MAHPVHADVTDSVTASAGAGAAAKLPDGDALTQAQPALIDRLPGGEHTFLSAYTGGLDTVFLTAGAFALVIAVLMPLLVKRSDFVPQGPPPAAAPDPA